ncbi:epididymal sperm-binding protein 1-like [Hydractinia symbiolongicarpus]|uniref:epididymal sperm-binding protein 1-like n=1 Tax=Hydractinia symbiolongicarpus TaxID=13093 RepID=UPI00254D85DB|nr:epididymal sperm-binding protein 1-like [Hydractinia symbiolongicarpus]
MSRRKYNADDEVDCIFPFEFKNVTYKSCTTVENKGQAWCSLDSKYRDRWKDCPSGSYIIHMHFMHLITSFWKNIWFIRRIVISKEISQNCHTKKTSNHTAARGEDCVFPFRYRGTWYERCITNDRESLWCSKDPVFMGNWKFCKSKEDLEVTNDKHCVFPFIYEGIEYKGCTMRDSEKPWCSKDAVFKDKWKYCPRGGEGCVFPFKYRGQIYNDCTRDNGEDLWCSQDAVFDGRSKKCTSSETDCIFPFHYNGKVFTSCTHEDFGRAWCSKDKFYKGRRRKCPVGKNIMTLV